MTHRAVDAVAVHRSSRSASIPARPASSPTSAQQSRAGRQDDQPRGECGRGWSTSSATPAAQNVHGEKVQKLDRVRARDHLPRARARPDSSRSWRPKRTRTSSRCPRASRSEVRASTSTRSTAPRTSTPTSTSGRSSRCCRASPRQRGQARSPTACQPGRSQLCAGLRDVRLEHHARLHHRPGRARLHLRAEPRRVPALAPRHPHPAPRPHLQRQRGQLLQVVRRA